MIPELNFQRHKQKILETDTMLWKRKVQHHNTVNSSQINLQIKYSSSKFKIQHLLENHDDVKQSEGSYLPDEKIIIKHCDPKINEKNRYSKQKLS